MRQPITFDSGYSGYQITDDDGLLQEVVITSEPDGSAMQSVFARRSDVQARVFSFSDLKPYGKWTVKLYGPASDAGNIASSD